MYGSTDVRRYGYMEPLKAEYDVPSLFFEKAGDNKSTTTESKCVCFTFSLRKY